MFKTVLEPVPGAKSDWPHIQVDNIFVSDRVIPGQYRLRLTKPSLVARYLGLDPYDPVEVQMVFVLAIPMALMALGLISTATAMAFGLV